MIKVDEPTVQLPKRLVSAHVWSNAPELYRIKPNGKKSHALQRAGGFAVTLCVCARIDWNLEILEGKALDKTCQMLTTLLISTIIWRSVQKY